MATALDLDLTIIAAPRLRAIAQDAARRLDVVHRLRLHKAAVLLAGTIAEAVLHDALDADGASLTLREYLRTAVERGVIQEGMRTRVPAALRNFRQLLQRDVADPEQVPDARTMDASVAWLSALVRDVRARMHLQAAAA